MEFDLIELIRERMRTRRPDVVRGIGDDAALLAPPPGHQLAVSIDTLVEGVHFLPGTPARDLGWKALAVNLSDLAAMGAEPAWAVVALTMPEADAGFVEGFVDGFAELAETCGLALVGGDMTRGPLAVSVAVHGLVPTGEGLLRSGARVGDDLCVTGCLGDAAAALHCLDGAGADVQALRARLERPQPCLRAGALLRGMAHAAIDVSDGLLADLGHICRASGVAAEVDVETLPQSAALLSVFDASAARDFALVGGDAYELCFTVAPGTCDRVRAALATVGCTVTRIGRMVAGEGVRVLDAAGVDITPRQRGWDHFQS